MNRGRWTLRQYTCVTRVFLTLSYAGLLLTIYKINDTHAVEIRISLGLNEGFINETRHPSGSLFARVLSPDARRAMMSAFPRSERHGNPRAGEVAAVRLSFLAAKHGNSSLRHGRREGNPVPPRTLSAPADFR